MPMGTIDKELSLLITEHPEDKYNVLIVFKEGVDLNKFKIRKYSLLMENIVSCILSGSRIAQLAENDSITSIESDKGMRIL